MTCRFKKWAKMERDVENELLAVEEQIRRRTLNQKSKVQTYPEIDNQWTQMLYKTELPRRQYE